MRHVILAALLGVSAAAVLPAGEAKAWWDPYGRWHPNVIRPPLVVAPPGRPGFYGPRPYAHWIPPHRNRWGRWVPGHWA